MKYIHIMCGLDDCSTIKVYPDEVKAYEIEDDAYLFALEEYTAAFHALCGLDAPEEDLEEFLSTMEYFYTPIPEKIAELGILMGKENGKSAWN